MLEVYELAKALIEQGWTQGCTARDAKDKMVETTHPDACKFCVLGAIYKASEYRMGVFDKAVRGIYRLLPIGPLADFNDHKGRTKEEVIKLFDSVIMGYKTLIIARDIVKKGWCQYAAAIIGDTKLTHGDAMADRHCMGSALSVAAAQTGWFKTRQFESVSLEDTFDRVCGIKNIVLFNDSSDTMKGMVVAAFDKVIGDVCFTPAGSSTH